MFNPSTAHTKQEVIELAYSWSDAQEVIKWTTMANILPDREEGNSI